MKKVLFFVFSLMLAACSDHDDDAPVLTHIDVVFQQSELPAGLSTYVDVMGYYDDGSTIPLAATATITSSDNLTVEAWDSYKVNVIGTGSGEASLTASYAGLSDTNSITITDAVLESIAITPDRIDLIEGLTQQYTATGTYSDGSVHDINESVSWTSSDTTVASINAATGLATALTSGNSTITAMATSVEGNTNLRVLYASVDSIEITSATEQTSLPIGVSQTFYATAFYDNGTSSDVTDSIVWSSSDRDVLSSHDGNNIFTALEIGIADVTAAFNSNVLTSNVMTINVEHKTYQGIEVTAESNEIPVGLTKKFTATAYFGENNEDAYDVSYLASWHSNSEFASVVKGYVHGNSVSTGQTEPVEITATFLDKSDYKTVWITDAILQSIDVTPDNVIISRGHSQQYTAHGTFSDGSSHDLTAEEGLHWSLSVNGDLDDDGFWDTSDENASITIDGIVTNSHENFAETTSDFVTANIGGVTGKEEVYLPTKIALKHNGLEFIGTPSIGEAQAMHSDYEDQLSYDALMTFDQAQTHCEQLVYNGIANWRLPTLAELEAFDDQYNPEGSTALNSVYNWPLIAGYWTSTISGDNQHHNINLLNLSANTSVDDDYPSYVSCVMAY